MESNGMKKKITRKIKTAEKLKRTLMLLI